MLFESKVVCYHLSSAHSYSFTQYRDQFLSSTFRYINWVTHKGWDCKKRRTETFNMTIPRLTLALCLNYRLLVAFLKIEQINKFKVQSPPESVLPTKNETVKKRRPETFNMTIPRLILVLCLNYRLLVAFLIIGQINKFKVQSPPESVLPTRMRL